MVPGGAPVVPGDLPTSTQTPAASSSSSSSNLAIIGKPQLLYSASASSISSGPVTGDASYIAPTIYSAPSTSVPTQGVSFSSGMSTTGAQQLIAKAKKKKDKVK